ncbi:UPF0182 family protein [Acidicapsa dinghuensis]|uniref:UPF0182 protein ACFPT7_11750 n=1 Tax=Acidicapsa dinghuensis TaxID=2218256 RepID=A0ABW1EF70_9BACT|nr:UPF0182 family protein [Acidicapsa dinghuensis]
MPETIDWVPDDHVPQRSRRGVLVLLLVIALLFAGSRTAVSFYVDSLWFRSLGYGEVFWKTLDIEWSVFAIFAALSFAVIYGAYLALRRVHADELPSGHTIYLNQKPIRLPVEPVFRVLAVVAALLVALISGASMMSEWPAIALWRYASARSGATDPIFGKPVEFYLFTLPAWHLILNWLLAMTILCAAMAALLLMVTGGVQAIERRRLRFADEKPRWRTISIALAFLLLVAAVREYVGRFDLLFGLHTIFQGVTYTDVHVAIPGMTVVAAALLLGTVIAAWNAVAGRNPRLLGLAVTPAILCFFGMTIVSWYVTNFVVKPNELEREKPYIVYNIEKTREAFGLDKFQQREFPAETTVAAADAGNNQPTIQNIRLWDWRPLQDTLRQIQEIRTYYDFPDIDIDRYDINGTQREVMLAARELNVDKLPESSRNWINEKLIYTHGYGVTMNPVNGFTPEGLPTLMLSNMPVQSTVPEMKISRPEIYFGELTNTDVYVKTKQQEFNYPQGDTNSLTTYEGTGGIELGGFLRRLLIAFDRGDLSKLPFSDDVGPQSRLLMRRNIRDRVSTVAPFLTFENDPYLVIGGDGRLRWIIDAYTTSNDYPYASRYQMQDGTANYVRNSVKAVVDAYDGTVTLYVFDAQDPIISAYRHIFPSLFRDAASMPDWLRKHVRYPETLLNVQGEVYGLYHMTDAGVFYNREDLWTVAREVGNGENGEQTTLPMQSNYVLMKLPGETGTEFVEILPFTPSNRNNLIGWIGARSDGANYGTAIVYDFPKTRLVDGPLQVEARIDQNAQISGQMTLWNQRGSQVRRGSLLVIPCGKALLYAEPIYLQAEHSPMPELRMVVLALQDRLAYGASFEAALSSLFGESGTAQETVASAEQSSAGGQPSTAAKSGDQQGLIHEAAQDFADYQRLTAEGRLGEAGQKLDALKKALDALSRSHL